MKSLMKIYSRYILTACLLIILLGIANLVFVLGVLFYHSEYGRHSLFMGNIHEIAGEIVCSPTEHNGSPYLTEEGIALLKKHNYCFSFLLSPVGDLVWEWEVPEGFPSHFSAADISAFSKWYLQDYPVRTWRYEDYLLVCGREKHSAWKYHMEFPETLIRRFTVYLNYALVFNLAILLVILLAAGIRFYSSLRPLAQGMDALAEGNTLSLTEKGVTAELCGKLNQTSLILKKQKDALAKRDDARTEWISGVSHDIRTPLSMIMGYADSLSADTALPAEQRQQAEIIKKQSITIKKLIEDLNLTSKLEYHMQPMHMETFQPAPFLRSVAAAYLNGDLGNLYDMELDIGEPVEGIWMEGDETLLCRPMNNIIGNSIRHNPSGCRIRICAKLTTPQTCAVHIRDNGCGIPEQVIRILEDKTNPADGSPHIMGLRIAKQIVHSHRGNFYFTKDRHGIVMEFPTANAKPRS